MQTIHPATISYDDDALPPITKGRVTVNGRSAVLWEWDPKLRKYAQADRITDATVSEKKKGRKVIGLSISGRSRLFAEDTGAGDATVTITVTGNGAGCENC